MKIKWMLLLGFILSLSALAQLLETSLRGVSVTDAQARVEAAVSAQGLKVARTLNLGGQVKNFKADFPDYLLMVLEPEAGVPAAVQENIMTAIILPPHHLPARRPARGGHGGHLRPRPDVCHAGGQKQQKPLVGG